MRCRFSVASESTTSRAAPDPAQRQTVGMPFGTSYVTGTNLSPLPSPFSSSQSVSPATSARYASALAPPRNAHRYSPPTAITARRRPSRSESSSTGRGGPRRASRAVSATTAELSIWAASARDAAGGSESQAIPASAVASGEGPGVCTYQSPSCRPPPPAAGQSRVAPFGANPLNAAGSPASITSCAEAKARATSLAGRLSSVVASRHPFPGRSVSTKVRTGSRATSVRVRARNRVSQSGGDASSTTEGWGLTSMANSRASSRGSSSLTPSNRTSSAVQPGIGTRDRRNVTSVDTMPLSGRITFRDAIRRPPRFTANVASRFPLPVSRFPAVP